MVTSVKCLIFTKFSKQFLATLTVNLIAFTHAVALGSISPILLALQSDDSPLESGKINLEQASWVTSLVALGGFTGTVFFGIMMDIIGRRNALRCIAIPHLFFWGIVAFGDHINYWYAARFIVGCAGGGVYLCIPMFVAEISDNKIRGTLGSMLVIFINLGILSGLTLGAYLEYSVLPKILAVAPIAYTVFVTMLPETPSFLLQKNQIAEAEKSFRFYQNVNPESKTEVDNLQKAFNELKERMQEVCSSSSKQRISIKDFCNNQARRGIIIGVVLVFVNQYSGCFAIINYAGSIFKEAGSNLPPNDSAIIIGFIQLVASYISTMVVDKCGRKILLIISSFGSAAGLITMGSYVYSGSDYKWIPIASLSFVIFIASIGILNLPFVILAEVLPTKIRSVASTACLSALFLLSFSLLKLYSVFMTTIQLYGIMWLCGSVCIFGGLFVIFFVPETKGKALPTAGVSEK